MRNFFGCRHVEPVTSERTLKSCAGLTRKRAIRIARHSHRYAIEQLESRTLLSVTAATLAGSFKVAGLTRAYQATLNGTVQSAVATQTVVGLTTFQGIQCYEQDTVSSSSGSPFLTKSYYNLDSSGNFVEYGTVGLVETTVYTPPRLIAPSFLSGGMPVNSVWASTLTQTDSNGVVTTDHESGNDVITLMSETPISVTLPASSQPYQAYDGTDVETDFDSQGRTIRISNQENWVVPSIGLVKNVSTTTTFDINGAILTTNTLILQLTSARNANFHLGFLPSPGDTAAGDAMNPAPAVEILDPSGNLETNATDAVTLSITPTSTGTGTLSGMLTQSAVGGIATFSGLSINEPGQYSLTATDAGVTTNSGLFKITGGKLVFNVAPSDGIEDTPLKPVVTVWLEDGQNNPITTENTATVSLDVFGNSSSNKISGNTATFVAGVATFPNLKFGATGFYKIQATDSNDDADVVSDRFKITGDHLVFVTQPKSSDVNMGLPLKVEIKNKKNQIDTNATSTIVLSLVTLSGGINATFSGTTMLDFVNGVAAFTGANAPAIDTGGVYQITATEEDSSTGVFAPTNITAAITSKQFAIAGYQLAVLAQPRATSVLGPIPLKIEIVDAKHRRNTNENSATVTLTLTIVTGGIGAQLQGTDTATFAAGIATFPASATVNINSLGTYTLTASEAGEAAPVASATTTTFKITGFRLVASPAAADRPTVARTEDIIPGAIPEGTQFSLVDATGRPVTDINGLPEVSLVLSGTGGGTLEGTTQTGAVNDLYIFRCDVTLPGEYSLAAQTVDTAGSAIPASAISPGSTGSFDVQTHRIYGGPELIYKGTNGNTVNTPVVAGMPMTMLYGVAGLPGQTGNPSDSIEPWIGLSIRLVAVGSQQGTLSGPAAVPVASSFSVFAPEFSIDMPGVYRLQFTEVSSPSGGSFDPNNYTPFDGIDSVVSPAFRVLIK